ncbi:carbohydrate-binding module family 20 domain-containing protein [Roseateles saccharophilus]|uniref:Alpha-amylase n=1 Tax=Roseateles saccharophilus TaxID=304 RepID=A0A4R3V5P4_ROSSA|nr:carbohydrate-binding module family 20 domain-containing protein [Roseateles saccharophilus]MDG0835316.1 alpha-amylase Aml [Roseateles saccharophilus]TCV00256.1 alpha-amylase [Roseateles saccharophilus]
MHKLPPSRRLFHALTLASSVALAAFAPPALALNPNSASVQMFEWAWPDIATECTQWLGPKGFGGVQISPPGASKNANGWWGVYQPVNYVNLNSRMGTPVQLQSMIGSCHAAGVRVYADVVVNQMADGSGTATDGSTWDAASLSYPYFSANDFHANCSIADSDYNSPAGRSNVQNCRLGGLPDLATESSYVQGQIANYLKALLALGVDGFRIDAAKHMPASAWTSIMSAVKAAYPTTLQGEPIWVTQEIINDGEVDRPSYFPVGTLNEFQFTSAMRDVFRGNNGLSLSSIPGVMGTWGNWGGSWGFIQPQNATVFITNWDTERNGGSLNINNALSNDAANMRYTLANIFMLAQGYGEAQLYSGYKFSDTGADRPTTSPYSGGMAQINVVWDFAHRWTPLANMVAFRNASIGQAQQNWIVGDNANQVAFSRGNVGFAALNNSGSPWTRTFSTGLPAGTYCNVINGTKNATGTGCTADSVTVDASGNASFTVPANSSGSTPAVAFYTGQVVGGNGGGGTTCAVSFTIANANTSYGQNLRVVGNVSGLGAWAPGSGFALTIQGSGANVPWTGTVSLPAGTAIQYKYVKWDGSTAVWESNQSTASGNREFTSCTGGGTQSRNDGNFKF